MKIRYLSIAAAGLLASACASSNSSRGDVASNEPGDPTTGAMTFPGGDQATPNVATTQGTASSADQGSSDQQGAMGQGSSDQGSAMGQGSGDQGSDQGSTMGQGSGDQGTSDQGAMGQGSGSSDEQNGQMGGMQNGQSGGMQGGEAAQGGDQSFSGRVTKVSKSSVSIRTSAGKTHKLELSQDTEYRVNGHTAHRTAIRRGEEVRATFTDQGGHPVAVSLDVHKKTTHHRMGRHPASKSGASGAAGSSGESGAAGSGGGTPGGSNE